jgi:poly(3-hydroxybutyrate) depolymerase
MQSLFLLTAVFAAFALGCEQSNVTAQAPGTVKNHTLCVDSLQRSYLLFVPHNYASDKIPRSLILSFHGGGRNAERQLKLDRLTAPFFNVDALVAYPQGLQVCLSVK